LIALLDKKWLFWGRNMVETVNNLFDIGPKKAVPGYEPIVPAARGRWHENRPREALHSFEFDSAR